MKKCTPFRLVVTSVFILFNLLIVNSVAHAQQSSAEPSTSVTAPARNWKPASEIQQILQQEITQTQATLQQPNLSDLEIIVHDGYLSVVTKVNDAFPADKDLDGLIARAVEQTFNENDARQPAAEDILVKVEYLKTLLAN